MTKTLSPEAKGETKRRYYQAHRSEILEKRKPTTRLRLYGLRPGEFSDLLVRQSDACAVCRTPFAGIAPNVDHDHETGRVRGLLCHRCNLMLGHSRDSATILRVAAEYLDKS